jgi:transposase, IS5 family
LIKTCKKIRPAAEKPANLNMLARQKNNNQLGFYSTFEEQLNRSNGLFILANQINWKIFDDAFSKHYSLTQGAPAKPIRLMVSLLILKQIRNLSDEAVVDQWAENSYFQYFSGENCFCSSKPCVPTEIIEFRKRIGEEGVELIFRESIRVNGKDGEDDNLSGDTTIQEKNITFPTDDKLYKKIIKRCHKISKKENIELRQSYTRTLKKLSFAQRMKHNKGGQGKARKASKKVKTIAGRLTRELERKLSAESLQKWGNDLQLFNRVLSQKKSDSNKIYSLHEPNVKCYSKGKEHKKYEFGSKVSIMVTQKTGVIVGALNFNESLHDTKTLEAALNQHTRLTGITAKNVYLDRGYPGRKKIGETNLHIPKPDTKITATKRKRHRRRAAIEPVIGHLKSDYRMLRNFLKGNFGDSVNVMMAAAAMNFKRMMNKWQRHSSLVADFFIRFYNQILFFISPTENSKQKLTF